MKKERTRITIYLPKELYAELRERQLYDHASFLFTRLLEEFFKTDVRISWSTLTNQNRKIRRLIHKVANLPSPFRHHISERIQILHRPNPREKA